MINTQFNTHEIQRNTQSSVYFLTFLVCIILTTISSIILFTPNELHLSTSNILSDNFVHNPRKGNRMLVGRAKSSKVPIQEYGKKAADKDNHSLWSYRLYFKVIWNI